MVRDVVHNGRAFGVAGCLLVGIVVVIPCNEVVGRVAQGHSADKITNTNDQTKGNEFVALHNRHFAICCEYFFELGPHHNSLNPAKHAYGSAQGQEQQDGNKLVHSEEISDRGVARLAVVVAACQAYSIR